jgi:predicted GNAT family acetyltransferase
MPRAIKSHSDPQEFFQQIKFILEGREGEYSLLCGLLESAKQGVLKSQPTMLECLDDEKVSAAAMVAGLHLILTAGSAAFLPELAKHLHQNKIQLPGVIGPDPDAQQFANEWCKIKNCKMKLAMNQRIYELRKVVWPTGVSGKARLVNAGDVPLLATWLEGFYLEALPWELPNKEKMLEGAKDRVKQSMTYFWEVDGVPVCMAALSRPSEHGISVNAVYTPAKFRNKGYASALVAAVSAEGLSRGKTFCVLYTDLNNPTSNSIYQKVGYRPVSDSKNYIFEYQTD